MMVVPVDRPDPAAAMWENLPVDTELGPLETTISDHDVKGYGYAVDDFHPWYMHDSPFGGRVVPPALLSVALFKLRHLPGNFTLMHGLHTREELQLFRAVRLGEPVTLRARVTDKFTKRGGVCEVTGREDSAGGSMRPILLTSCSVNHSAPSEPAAM
jgi:hypothetical protein